MIRLLPVLALAPAAAMADVPRVMTDFAPIHSLTAQVMGDLGTPDVLLPPGADPHDFALRPSDADNLGMADLLIWTGPDLTPWLSETMATLAPQATRLTLLDLPGWDRLETREIASFTMSTAGAGHDDDGHDNDDHGHDDHDAGHSDHDHDAHDDHDHGTYDPHAWLDPRTAQVWLAAIADELSAADPENAAVYASNADTAIADLADLDTQIAAQLAPVAGAAYILPHDGYQYFENRYNLTAAGAISGIDARTPGPAQIATLRDQMAGSSVVCVFSDAEIGDRWAQVVTENTNLRTAQIDGVGLGLDSGPALYTDLLQRLADDFATCLRDN